MKNETKQTCAHGAGRVLRGQHGCCLLVVRSVLLCVQLMDNRKTTKNAGPRNSQDEGRAKVVKNKSTPQRGGGFSLDLYLPGVSRWSGVIWHDISRYIVMSYPMSCDITRYDISRYGIHIPNFWDWYRDVVSRRNIPRYRTQFFAQYHQVWCTKILCMHVHNTQEDVPFFLFRAAHQSNSPEPLISTSTSYYR